MQQLPDCLSDSLSQISDSESFSKFEYSLRDVRKSFLTEMIGGAVYAIRLIYWESRSLSEPVREPVKELAAVNEKRLTDCNIQRDICLSLLESSNDIHRWIIPIGYSS